VRVAAVIVTYNRLQLLQKCLNSIREQTRRPDVIIIVNNGSTDDTLSWLSNQPDVQTITQNNLGGGGGQCTGIKTAYELGFDWIWCMDEDGIPDADALRTLLYAADKVKDGYVFNSLVLDKDNHEIIAFGYHLNYNIHDLTQSILITHKADFVNAINGDCTIVEGLPQFFNSTLLHKTVISAIGLPMRELFIRGDEFEYVLRIQKKGFKTFTVLNSSIYHPNPILKTIKMFGIPITYEPMQDWKLYYTIRNKIFIDNKYCFKKWRFHNYAKIILKMIIISWYEKHSIDSVVTNIRTILAAIKDSKLIESH
jgi:GT2 family glycosyltransferase